jgi:chromosome segregation ATPase
MKTDIRELKYDKKLDKYVLFIENSVDLKEGKRTVGTQTKITKQIWDKDQIGVIKQQVEDQKDQVEDQIESIDRQLTKQGKISVRERQQLKEFYDKLQKAQKLQKIEQLENQKKEIKKSLEKIKKDLKEINDVIEN